jgi:hypothetical protein
MRQPLDSKKKSTVSRDKIVALPSVFGRANASRFYNDNISNNYSMEASCHRSVGVRACLPRPSNPMHIVRQVLRAFSVVAAPPGPSSVHGPTRDAFARNPLWNGRATRFRLSLSAPREPAETFSGRTRVYALAVENNEWFHPQVRAEQSPQKLRSMALDRDDQLPPS